jgi:hypothetical protein
MRVPGRSCPGRARPLFCARLMKPEVDQNHLHAYYAQLVDLADAYTHRTPPDRTSSAEEHCFLRVGKYV